MGTEKSGGVGVAAGVEFQYRCTLDAALALLESGESAKVLESESGAADIIDYSVRDGDAFDLVVQAKAAVDGMSGESLGLGETAQILRDLIKIDSARYELRTNRPFSKAVEKLSGLLPILDLSRDVETQIADALERTNSRKSARARFKGLTPSEFARLARCRLVQEGTDTPETLERLVSRIRELRRNSGHGLGPASGQVLIGSLVANILALSSKPSGRQLTYQQLHDLTQPDDSVVAGALGRIDWGLISGRIPSIASIGRAAELDELRTRLPFPGTRGTPRRLTITGLSGLGKSTLAAAFARRTESGYDKTLWIDATSSTSVRESLTDILCVAPDEDLTDEQLAARLSACTMPDVARWLLVFDNAGTGRDLATWIPHTGIVDVIATSTDSRSWAGWETMELGPFTEQDGLELVDRRMSIRTPEDHTQAELLIRSLGYWPLAIELACAFLGAAQRDLRLTDSYLDDLKRRIADDPSLIPDEYRGHPTLIAAIDHAVQTVAGRRFLTSPSPVRVLQTLSFLPANLADVRFAITVAKKVLGDDETWETIHVPEVSELELDDVTSALRAASLVERVPGRAGDVFRTNTLVLDVIRNRLSEAAARELLLHAQLVAYRVVKTDLDARDLHRFPNHLPSISVMLGFAAVHGAVLTMCAAPLCGNIAMGLTSLSRHFDAAKWYEQELALLAHHPTEAPALRAKALVGLAFARLQINEPIGTILTHLEAAAADLETVDSSPPINMQDVHDAFIDVLRSTEIRGAENAELAPRILALKTQIQTSGFLESERRGALHRISQLLHESDGDEAALALITSARGEYAWKMEEMMELSTLEFDALANLSRFDEAGLALDHLVRENQRHGFGDESLFHRLLNTWVLQGQRQLAVTSPPDAAAFMARLGAARPAEVELEPADMRRALVAAAAEIVMTGPLDALDSYLEQFTRAGEAHSNLIKPAGDAIPYAMFDACRRIAAVRERNAAAPLVNAVSLRGGEELDQTLRVTPVAEVLVTASDWDALLGWRTGVSATLIQSADGLGIHLEGTHPLIIWLCRNQTGWLRLVELDPSPLWTRAQELLTAASSLDNRILVRIMGSVSAHGSDILEAVVDVR